MLSGLFKCRPSKTNSEIKKPNAIQKKTIETHKKKNVTPGTKLIETPGKTNCLPAKNLIEKHRKLIGKHQEINWETLENQPGLQRPRQEITFCQAALKEPWWPACVERPSQDAITSSVVSNGLPKGLGRNHNELNV